MTENEEKVDIVQMSHRSQEYLNLLRRENAEGVQRSRFSAGMSLSYVDETIYEEQAKDSSETELKVVHNFNPKFRFRAAVRLVMAHLVWMSATPDDPGKKDDFAFNARRIRRKKGPMSLLTYQEKMILMKSPFMRTEEEIEQLVEAFSKVKRFRGIKKDLLLNLAKSAEFFCFGPNREVTRKGSLATGVYLITSGEVSFLRERMDNITLTFYVTPSSSLGPGETVGEPSLLHGIPHLSTVVTMAMCEMVYWHETEYEEVLEKVIRVESNRILNILSMFSYFEKWGEIALKSCSIRIRTEDYPRHAVIRAYGVGEEFLVHIVMKGECHVIHRLDMIHGVYKNGKPFIPYPYKGGNIPPGCVVRTHLLSIARFRRGMVFNLGESWMNRVITAYTDVNILLIPIEFVEEFGSRDNTWEMIKLFIKREVPDENKIYREYYQKMQWIEHRGKLREDIIKRYQDPKNTEIRNIPIPISHLLPKEEIK